MVALATIPLWLLDTYVPRRVEIVTGTVLMFEFSSNNAPVTYALTVRLDSGGIAHAANPARVPVSVGRRVKLTETVGMLTGMRRYRFEQMR